MLGFRFKWPRFCRKEVLSDCIRLFFANYAWKPTVELIAGVRHYMLGVEGERIRTKKLMGQLSQGLVLDLKHKPIMVK